MTSLPSSLSAILPLKNMAWFNDDNLCLPNGLWNSFTTQNITNVNSNTSTRKTKTDVRLVSLPSEALSQPKLNKFLIDPAKSTGTQTSGAP